MRRLIVALAPLLAVSPVAAQGNGHLTAGDSAYRALQPAAALAHYEAGIARDSTDYEALWKASRSLADLAEYDGDKDKRAEM
ncbi:MAG TPA: hypothetical protein VFU01_04605, partial [Gemmatimonadaceae bacterium]|nr:hypothetical protein [Gemmatimonadaceae bacterium]